MLQRTEEWFEMRRGRFTASQIHRLLGKETLQRTKDGIANYAFEKAVESIYGHLEEDFISYDMQRGIDLEPLAFKRFKELRAYEFVGVDNCVFYPHNEHAGASPDGICDNNSILEIKCPKRNKFFKIVANGEIEIDSQYIAQMQMQMLCTNSEKSYFFNYYIEEGIEFWHEIIVNRDEEMIDLIKQRIIQATEIKLNFIEKINNNKQF